MRRTLVAISGNWSVAHDRRSRLDHRASASGARLQTISLTLDSNQCEGQPELQFLTVQSLRLPTST